MSGKINFNSIGKPAPLERQSSSVWDDEADADKNPKVKVNFNALGGIFKKEQPLQKAAPKLQKQSSMINATKALLKSHFENQVNNNIQPSPQVTNPSVKPKVVVQGKADMSGGIPRSSSIEKPAPIERQFSMSDLSDPDDDDGEENPLNPQAKAQIANFYNNTSKPLPKIAPKLQKQSSKITATAALLKSHFENRANGNMQPPAKVMNPPAKPKLVLVEGTAKLNEDPATPRKKMDLIPGIAKMHIDLEPGVAHTRVDLEPGGDAEIHIDAEEAPHPIKADAAPSTPAPTKTVHEGQGHIHQTVDAGQGHIHVVYQKPVLTIPSTPVPTKTVHEGQGHIHQTVVAGQGHIHVVYQKPAIIIPSTPTPTTPSTPVTTPSPVTIPESPIASPKTPVTTPPSSPTIIPNDMDGLPDLEDAPPGLEDVPADDMDDLHNWGDIPDIAPKSTTKPSDSSPPSPRFEVSLRDKEVRFEYQRHEGIIRRQQLETVHWFIAGIMNFFALLLPWWVQGAAEFKIDGESFYAKRSLIQEKLQKALIQRGAFKGSAEQNTAQLKQAALDHFSRF